MRGRPAGSCLVVFLMITTSFVRPVVRGAQSSVFQTVSGPAPRTAARVHHVHFLVDDPIAAIRNRADRSGGTVVPLPGLGAGVRIGNHYLLFDPSPGSSPLLVPGPFRR